jgi:hypothetical protein
MRNHTPVSIAGGQFSYLDGAPNSPFWPELLKVAAERPGLDAGFKGSVLADPGALAVAMFGVGATGDGRGLLIGDRTS